MSECKFLSIIADEGLHPSSSLTGMGGGRGGEGSQAGRQCSGYHEIARYWGAGAGRGQ